MAKLTLRKLVRFRLGTLLLLMIPLGISFVGLGNYLFENRPIAWTPYSKAALDESLRNGRIVLVNFTADWNPTSRMHEKFALEQPAVRRAMRFNQVVALRADWTYDSTEIKTALNRLGENSIPLVAVYPGAPPHKPILIRDWAVLREENIIAAIGSAADAAQSSQDKPLRSK